MKTEIEVEIARKWQSGTDQSGKNAAIPTNRSEIFSILTDIIKQNKEAKVYLFINSIINLIAKKNLLITNEDLESFLFTILQK